MIEGGGDGICGGWTGIEGADDVAQPCNSVLSSSNLASALLLVFECICSDPLYLLTKGLLPGAGRFLGLCRGFSGQRAVLGQLDARSIGLKVAQASKERQGRDDHGVDDTGDEVEQLDERDHSRASYLGMRVSRTSRTWCRLMSHAERPAYSGRVDFKQ